MNVYLQEQNKLILILAIWHNLSSLNSSIILSKQGEQVRDVARKLISSRNRISMCNLADDGIDERFDRCS